MDRSHESTLVTSAELENIASGDVATLNTLVFRCHLYITHQVMMKPSLLSLVESKRPETRRCSVHKSDVSPFHKLVMTYARYRGRLHPAPDDRTNGKRQDEELSSAIHQPSCSSCMPVEKASKLQASGLPSFALCQIQKGPSSRRKPSLRLPENRK